MGSIGTPAPAPRGFVLHKKQIDAMPLENFSNNSKRATGGWKQIFSSPDTPTDGLNLGKKPHCLLSLRLLNHL